MKSIFSLRAILGLAIPAAFLLPCLALAQEPAPSEGVNSGNYNIRQTIEFGYRFIPDDDFKDSRGTRAVYNTFVNLGDGFRLFEHTLEMRSLNHQGWLFDDLFLSSFGYGGDPNDVSRLRMYKNQWYNFSATFRRDRNFWDYNLLANPLNPNVPVANAPAGFSPVIVLSPHRFETTRRMSDFNLTVLPQSRVRLRLSYSRNIHEGPSFTSFHEGTDVLTFQDWKTTLNSYQIGVDFKVLPRTNISYDQFLHYYKGDTSWVDNNQTFVLSDGVTPVDLGLPFNTPANQPCGQPFNPSTAEPTAPSGTVNATCNGYLLYQRAARIRVPFPTEQLSFQSSYLRNLDLSGRFVYSSSDGEAPIFQENFGFDQNNTGGLVTRTRQRQFEVSGPAVMKRISVSTDLGMTWQVTSKFRIVDMFRFASFRIPGQWNFAETSLFGTSMLVTPNVFTPGSSPPPNCPTITSPGCPQHSSSSPADVISGQVSLFLKQDLKNNQVQFDYEFNRFVGARVGYRYRHRTVVHEDFEVEDLLFFPTLPNRGACAGQPLLPDGSCQATVSDSESDTTEINEHSALFGIWARVSDAFRMSFDLELMSADKALTRISPRQRQQYKARAKYKPTSWASLGLTFNILENRDNVAEVFNKQHYRTYGFSAIFEPSEKFALDLGYDFNDPLPHTTSCVVGPVQPPGTTPRPTAAALLQQISLYDNDTHFAYFSLMWKPWKRLTTNLGYNVTSTSGQTLILNPNAPPGPLQFNYHRPFAGIAVDLAKGFTWKTNWGYYGYNEKAQPDPTGPRDFRGNMFTVAMRYAF